MYQKLNRSYSTNEIKTPYRSPYKNNQSNYEKEATQTTNSTRRRSFYDLVCRNCYKTRETARSFTPISNPNTDKLNHSFTSVNPFIFQDQMDSRAKDKIRQKVNLRMNNTNKAIENLNNFKKENLDPKENLQYSNQYSTYSGFDGRKDPRYEKMKRNYDMRQKLISSNPQLYDLTKPRKAIKDYYDKIVYEVPLMEPLHTIDKSCQNNFRNELKKQIEEKERKNNEERTFQKLREKKGIEEYNRFLQEQNKNQTYYKLNQQKKFYEENKRLLEIKRQKEKEEQLQQREYERKLNEKLKRENERISNDKLEKKINDIEQMNQYMKEIEREKQRKNKEENEERKRWSNYSEEFIVKCQHGNIYERCAICNNLFPRNKLIRCPKK